MGARFDSIQRPGQYGRGTGDGQIIRGAPRRQHAQADHLQAFRGRWLVERLLGKELSCERKPL
jgi:hypothetical protein